MKPAKHNISIYQGTSWRLKTTFKDPEGAAIDLSGYDGRMQIRRSLASTEAILTLDSDQLGGITLTADPEFNLTLAMTATQTSDLPTHNQEVEDWVYDVFLWETADAENTTIRLIQGEARIFPAVTRDDE